MKFGFIDVKIIAGLACFWIGCQGCLAQKLTDTYYTVDDFSEREMLLYFEETGSLDSIEGIWESDLGLRVAISRFHDEWYPKKTRYRMVVIDNFSEDHFWKSGYVKAFITVGKRKNDYKVDYFVMSDKKLWVYEITLKSDVSKVFSLNKRGLYETYRKVRLALPKSGNKDTEETEQEEKIELVPRL